MYLFHVPMHILCSQSYVLSAVYVLSAIHVLHPMGKSKTNLLSKVLGQNTYNHKIVIDRQYHYINLRTSHSNKSSRDREWEFYVADGGRRGMALRRGNGHFSRGGGGEMLPPSLPQFSIFAFCPGPSYISQKSLVTINKSPINWIKQKENLQTFVAENFNR